MDPLKIIRKYYKKDSKAYNFVVVHGELVAKKAVAIAKRAMKKNPKLKIDLKFLKEAAMLHDIGIYKTNAREIGCYGEKPYIEHGIIGRQILEKEGFPKHALVCERHIGVGLTKKDIKDQHLPLPQRDMIPKTNEEKIICLADKFYSKYPPVLRIEKSIETVRLQVQKWGKNKLKKLDKMLADFGIE